MRLTLQAPKFDLSGTMLTNEHVVNFKMKQEAQGLAENRFLTDNQLTAEMNRASKNRFIDDYPGLRGEAQHKYAVYRNALARRAKARAILESWGKR